MLTKIFTGFVSSIAIIAALALSGCASDNMKSMEGSMKEDGMKHDTMMKEGGMKHDTMMKDSKM